jgi:hypothetical protein
MSMLENPLRVEGKSLIPRIGASFDSSETIYIHGKVNVQGAFLNPEYRIVLASERGDRLFEGPWKVFADHSDNILDINARLPLNQLGPGSYRVLAEVRTSESAKIELARAFSIIANSDRP